MGASRANKTDVKKAQIAIKITAGDILDLLRTRFGSDKRKYICASEVAITTGGGARRIDFCVMTCYASQDFAIEGIEIKVDPSDLRHEIQEHKKHEAFFSCFDYYSIAVTEQAYAPCKDIIPKEWGIYIARETNESVKERTKAVDDGVDDIPDPVITLTCKRKPLPLPDRQDNLPRGFVASFARKCVSDALAPYYKKDRSEYDRGYAEGREYGIREGRRDSESEISLLREYKALQDRLTGDDGYFSFFSLEENLDLIAAMNLANVRTLFNAISRIHEDTGNTIAALSGRFDLDKWAHGGDSEYVGDEEVKKMIDDYDERMDAARKRTFERRNGE